VLAPRACAPSQHIAMPKLSVIVISYNMARELPRTIRSLSAAMQKNIDPGEYEVIVIDNGSVQPFDEAAVRRFIPDLVVHRFTNATVSPVPAINYGLTLARGDLVGVFIDGARMSSPGLLARALSASKLHERPMIGTIAFHLGPQVQMESIKHGYNHLVEDELLANSGWETDGYRLFAISAFAGSSAGGWFDLPVESNAVFLRAEHWRALGGWDEGFVSPGGGLVNLDTWSRIAQIKMENSLCCWVRRLSIKSTVASRPTHSTRRSRCSTMSTRGCVVVPTCGRLGSRSTSERFLPL
jgi:glycosyltransferase involved in cell wall biosynthesis